MSDKPKLPFGADTIARLGTCKHGHGEHAIALKDGMPVAAAHVREVQDGQPVGEGELYFVDPKTGRVKDAVRIGKGPAKVSTDKYRNGWEAIFGEKGELN